MVFGQSINDYKYVIVPKKYSFFKEENKYNLNSNTKLMLEKYGFEAFMEDETPKEIANNRCHALLADVVEERSLFFVKLKIVLKDCQGFTVYETEVGQSREKDFKISYPQAFRQSANSFNTLNYKYQPKKQDTVIVKNDKPTETIKTADLTNENTMKIKPTDDGFLVLNAKNEVIYTLHKTAQNEVFVAFKGTLQGVLTKSNNEWIFEYFENGKKVTETLAIQL
jgi:hypothetical protein